MSNVTRTRKSTCTLYHVLDGISGIADQSNPRIKRIKVKLWNRMGRLAHGSFRQSCAFIDFAKAEEWKTWIANSEYKKAY